MFKREGEGTFEIITDFEGEYQIYRSTKQHTKRTMFQPWLVAVLNDISLTTEQKKKFLIWAKPEVENHLKKADPQCEQEDEEGKKAREKFIQEHIELMISGLKKVCVVSPEKLSLARVKLNEELCKYISERVS